MTDNVTFFEMKPAHQPTPDDIRDAELAADAAWSLPSEVPTALTSAAAFQVRVVGMLRL